MENSCGLSVGELLVDDASVKIVSNSNMPQGYSVDVFQIRKLFLWFIWVFFSQKKYVLCPAECGLTFSGLVKDVRWQIIGKWKDEHGF